MPPLWLLKSSIRRTRVIVGGTTKRLTYTCFTRFGVTYSTDISMYYRYVTYVRTGKDRSRALTAIIFRKEFS